MRIELPACDPDWISLDTECSGLYPDDGATVACVAITWIQDGEYRSAAYPFDQGERDKIPTLQFDIFNMGEDPNLGREDWEALLDWLAGRRISYTNAKYDMTMMRTGTRHWPGRDLEEWLWWDTMIASRTLEPTEPAGLDATARRYGVGQKDGRDELVAWLTAKRYKRTRYDLAPWDIVQPYVTVDSLMTHKCVQHQLDMIAKDNRQRDLEEIQRELELLKVLYRMEQRGIGYDHERSLAAAELLEQRAAEIQAKMPFDCSNRRAVHDYFFKELGLTPRRISEKTGKPSLDEEQVREWYHEGVQWAYEYTMVTRARRAVSMWYRGYPEKAGPDGRLRCSFKQTHVKSGRMSVERIQLQALPKGDKYKIVGEDEDLPIFKDIPPVRSLVLPRDGYGVWSLDLAQAELRVASKYSGCQKMLERLLNGGDPHGDVAEEVLLTPRDAPNFKTQRDIAKRVNFGGIFMVGGRRFQETLAKLANIHMPLHECERIVRGWRRMYPEFQWAYRKAMVASGTRGYVRILPNTKYESRSWFLDRELWWDNRLQMKVASSAWNRIVQGSLAAAFRLLMIEVERRWPGYLILTVHDALELEMPLSEGAAIAREVAEFGGQMMTELFGVTMLMDTEIMALPRGVTKEEVPA